MHTSSTSLAAWALAGAVAAFASMPIHAADASQAKATYLKERADCEAGKTAEDRATCLKEAGAAYQQHKRNQLDNQGSLPDNAAERCNVVPAKDKADCLARAKGAPTAANQRTTTSGSVAGGGVLTETTTTIVGEPTIVMVPAAPAASGTTN